MPDRKQHLAAYGLRFGAILLGLFLATPANAQARQFGGTLAVSFAHQPTLSGDVRVALSPYLSVVASAHHWRDRPENIDVGRKIDHRGLSLGLGLGAGTTWRSVAVSVRSEMGRHRFSDGNRTNFLAAQYSASIGVIGPLSLVAGVRHQRTLSFDYPDVFGDVSSITYPSRWEHAVLVGLAVRPWSTTPQGSLP